MNGRVMPVVPTDWLKQLMEYVGLDASNCLRFRMQYPDKQTTDASSK